MSKTVAALSAAGADYMLTGSLVSSLQGEPRLTHDIDVVVALDARCVDALLAGFPEPQYYLSRPAVLEAIAERRMFNLIDRQGGDKVDFWLLTDSPFDRSRFSRRREANILGTMVMVSSPEDTILAKLKWAKDAGGSEKQFVDALRVFEMQYGRLDLNYIEEWIRRLELLSLWTNLLSQAQPLNP